MYDLISRKAVLEATSTTLKITGKENAETVYAYIKKMCDDIKALPSVDAVEVVRCENCTYAETATGWLDGYLWCVKDFETGCGQKMVKQKDDFCSFGERKTDG